MASPKYEAFSDIDDNFIEGVEKMHAELHNFIKSKDEQMFQINKQKMPFKATLNELQRGNWDVTSPHSATRRSKMGTPRRSPVRYDVTAFKFGDHLASKECEDVRAKNCEALKESVTESEA